MIKTILILSALLILYYVFLFLWKTLKGKQDKQKQDQPQEVIFAFEPDDNLKQIDVSLEEQKLEAIRANQPLQTKDDIKEKIEEPKQKVKETSPQVFEKLQEQQEQNVNLWGKLVAQFEIRINDLQTKCNELIKQNSELQNIANSNKAESVINEPEAIESGTIYKSGISASELFSQGIEKIAAKRRQDISFINI